MLLLWELEQEQVANTFISWCIGFEKIFFQKRLNLDKF